MAIIRDPDKNFGPNGALETPLALLDIVGLKPSRSKYQYLGPADAALKDGPDWFMPKAIDMRDQEPGNVVLGGLTGLPKKGPWDCGVWGTEFSDVFKRSWLAAKADEI